LREKYLDRGRPRIYWANNEGREDEKLCRKEKTGRKQEDLDSCYKLLTNDDDDKYPSY
jgi:hypothetical protein